MNFWSNIGSTIGNRIDDIITFNSNFWGNVGTTIGNRIDDIINFNLNFWSNLWQGFTNLVENLFIPNQQWLENQQANTKNLVNTRLGNLPDLTVLQVQANNDSIELPFIMGSTISLAWFAPYATPFKVIFQGLLYFFTLFYIIQRIWEIMS